MTQAVIRVGSKIGGLKSRVLGIAARAKVFETTKKSIILRFLLLLFENLIGENAADRATTKRYKSMIKLMGVFIYKQYLVWLSMVKEKVFIVFLCNLIIRDILL